MTVTNESKIFYTIGKQLPIAVDGNGVYLTVRDPNTGALKTVLDGSSGAAVSSIGHCDSDIQARMKAASEKQIYTFPTTCLNEPSEKLADFIIENSPPNSFAACLFTGSGSESNENLLKIAFKYQQLKGKKNRVKFISRQQSYHGFTLGALSLCHNNKRHGFDPILLPSERTPKASHVYPYRQMRDSETSELYKDRLLKEFEELVISEGPETICCFIAETIGGSTFGCQPSIPGYLDGMRSLCHKYGILFCLDEVMSGMGRSGSFHAWELYMNGAGPDIQTVGKCLGGGYVTIAAVLISPKVVDVYRENKAMIAGAQTYHSHAFNCQVALEVQLKVKNENLIQNMKEVGNYFGSTLRAKSKDLKYVGDVRGEGGFWAIEFVKDKSSKEPFPRDVNYWTKFSDKLYENGAFCLSCPGTIDGVLGDHALFSPAFTFKKEEADELILLIVKTCKDLEIEEF